MAWSWIVMLQLLVWRACLGDDLECWLRVSVSVWWDS
jgi:hypothetical protein